MSFPLKITPTNKTKSVNTNLFHTLASSSTTNKNLKKIQTFLSDSIKDKKIYMTEKAFPEKVLPFQSPSKQFERKYNFIKNQINNFGVQVKKSKFEVNVDLIEKENLKRTKIERKNKLEANSYENKIEIKLIDRVDFKKRRIYEEVLLENKEKEKSSYGKKVLLGKSISEDIKKRLEKDFPLYVCNKKKECLFSNFKLNDEKDRIYKILNR